MHPLIAEAQKSFVKAVPEIRPGYTVQVVQKIREGEKERQQAFEGLVIKVGHGQGPNRTFTVRKVVEGVGVEKVFLLFSSNIVKIDIKKKAQVRRAKLYYMRRLAGKSARLSERHVTDEERAVEEVKMQKYIEEAVKAEAKRKKEEEALAGEKDAALTEASEKAEKEAKTEEKKAVK